MATVDCSPRCWPAPLQPRQRRYTTTSDVYSFQSGLTAVAGASASLVRNRNGISFTLDASELQPGHAYTVWWIVFSDPQYCTDPLLSGCGAGSAT